MGQHALPSFLRLLAYEVEIANGLSFPALNVLPVVRVCSDEALAILKRVEETLKSPPVDLGLLAELYIRSFACQRAYGQNPRSRR